MLKKIILLSVVLSLIMTSVAFDAASWQKSSNSGKIENISGVCRITLADVPQLNNGGELSMDDGIAEIQYPKTQLIFTKEFTVKPETLYLLKLSVKSENAAVMRAGRRIMAYTRPGEKQLLCDLVKSDKSGKLTVSVELGGLPGKSVYELSGFELREPELAARVPQRPVYGETKLEKDSVIIAPALFQAEAQSIQQAIKARCGLELKIVTDIDATYKDRPELLDEYKAQHLIILGNINNNRAVWAAYNKFLAAVDGYYPGKGGYVVRTAANVFGNRRNHIIIGGSDNEGVKQAAAAFKCRIKGAVIPFLLEVKLGGECLAAFNANEKLWNTNPRAAGPKLLEPGYGKVIRWYINVMGYYWSGRESYKKRSQLYLKEILKDQAYTHHYILEFFVRAYDMVDHAGIFTQAERSQIESLLKKNFVDFLTADNGDLIWMRNFGRPYELFILVNRHQIAPYMADITNADFLAQNVPLNADERAIVQYRREEKHAYLRFWSATSFCPSLPRTIVEVEDELPASLFRYALSNEHYAVFTSGNARKTLHLWDISPRHPMFMDDRFLAGIVAAYYKDPGFVWLYRNMPMPRDIFQMRYLCGVHRYAPAPELPAEEPLSEAGVRRSVFQMQDHILWQRLSFGSHLTPDFPAEKGSQYITFRTGFKPADDFMKISTLGTTTGAITEFSSCGINLLRTASSPVGLPSARYYECNAVNIQQLDKIVSDPKPYGGAARIDSLVNRNGSGSASFTVSPFAGCTHQRSIAQLGRGRFVVRDVITANENGEYLIQIGWHPQGTAVFNGKVWQAINGKVNFYLTPVGEKFRVVSNLELFNNGSQNVADFHFTAHQRLLKGESVTAYTLLEVFPDHTGKPASFEHGKDGMLRINGELFRFTADGRLEKADAAALFTALASSAGTTAANSDVGSAVYEETDSLDVVQVPGILRFRNRIINGRRVVDFGREYTISEIRAAQKMRFWAPRTLPADLEYSTDGKSFHKISSPVVWHSGVKTANYGQGDPQAQAYQSTYPGVKARYISGSNMVGLLFMSSDAPDAGSNLEIVPAGDGFIVQSAIFPKFLRDRVSHDYLYARFDGSFALRYKWRAPGCVQDNKIIRINGRELLCVVTDDAKIHLVDTAGKVEKVIDLYRLQGEFHRRYGSPRSRQPMGGFTIPFSIGVWQETPDSEALLTIARYGYVSFVTFDGKLKGVLYTGDYVLGRTLDNGVKLPDGTMITFSAAYYNLIRVSGPENPRRHANCPMIYNNRNFRMPANGTAATEGDAVYIFQPVTDRDLAVCRASFLAIFDMVGSRWKYSWKAPVALSAAGMINQKEYLTAGNDLILRHITLDASLQNAAAVKNLVVRKTIRNIRTYRGRTLVINGDGVFEYRDGILTLLFAGDCRDAAIGNDGKMMVLMNDGKLIICKEK